MDFDGKRIPTPDEVWDMYERGEFDNTDTDTEDEGE